MDKPVETAIVAMQAATKELKRRGDEIERLKEPGPIDLRFSDERLAEVRREIKDQARKES